MCPASCILSQRVALALPKLQGEVSLDLFFTHPHSIYIIVTNPHSSTSEIFLPHRLPSISSPVSSFQSLSSRHCSRFLNAHPVLAILPIQIGASSSCYGPPMAPHNLWTKFKPLCFSIQYHITRSAPRLHSPTRCSPKHSKPAPANSFAQLFLLPGMPFPNPFRDCSCSSFRLLPLCVHFCSSFNSLCCNRWVPQGSPSLAGD